MSNEGTKSLELGGERKRVDPFLKGVREGAIKKGIDTVSGKVSLPMAEAINAKLQEMHPNMSLTAPMVQSGMQAMIILGMAELLDVAGPHVPGDVGSKAGLGALMMRKYAGEKVGADIIESAMQFLPVIMAAFAEVSTEDLMASLEDGEEEDRLMQEVEQDEFEEEGDIEDLFLEDDDEDEEIFAQVEEPEEEVAPEPEVARVAKRKPRKKRVSKSL